jgi:hypothetical protein
MYHESCCSVVRKLFVIRECTASGLCCDKLIGGSHGSSETRIQQSFPEAAGPRVTFSWRKVRRRAFIGPAPMDEA